MASIPTSAGDDNASQREPTLKDIFDMMQGIQQEQAAQRVVLARLSSAPGVSFQDDAFRTPPDRIGRGMRTQDARLLGEPQSAPGSDTAIPPSLQPGHAGGPYGWTPVAPERESRFARARPSLGVSGFPLPPQASPALPRGQGPPHTETRPAFTPYRSTPRDSDPALQGVKEDLLTVHNDYLRDLHPDWTDARIEAEARIKTAEDYLAMRKRAIEETLTGTVTPTKTPHDTGRPYRRVNWDMVKIITKLGWHNWSDWRSRIYSLLGTVPGAIGVLEGTIYGPRYLDPDDLSAHPNYDEALDLELGQVIQSCTEPEVNSLLLKPISDGELRGSFFYRELRVWLVPNQGYAALKLIAKMGQHRQGEGESVRQFGERLRRFYLELQSAGETLAQTKQVGFLLTGLRFRFHTVRDSVVSRQAAGEAFTFEKALHILAEAEESFGAFDDQRRNATTTRTIPPLSRPSAHVAEEDADGYGFAEDMGEDDIQAFAAQFARNFIARRRAANGTSFSGACFNCKKTGHRAAECPEDRDPPRNVSSPGAHAAQHHPSQAPQASPHTCGKDTARASFANVPAIGAFEAQVWEDELDALPSAMNVVTSA
ncbi:hypothetical protein A4X06_0g182 [Tilletia controversa]|uniref:CCHC-type domain-containing protein n=1 Tax=Tilletia controversa TaxID=13291 RepID=A0A8X7T0V7_9BASI|nr:hypothetical protein CF328_g8438 [Tilletia controversa]KAE8255891.1 hypothetical protein A4X06_0g182 [Tilletia controversa]